VSARSTRWARTAAASIIALAGFALAPPPVLAADAPPAPPAAPAPDQRAAHPNIVLVILDDIGLDTASNMYPGLISGLVRQYGPSGLNDPNYRQIEGRPASTPILDGFAAQGMAFREAWAQPFCSPTRASILTGLYAGKTGVRDYTNYLTQNSHSLAQDLKASGYSTAIFGKWHMAGLTVFPGMKPKEGGFDLFQGNLNGAIGDYWDYDYQVQDAASPPDKWRDEAAPINALPGVAPTTYAPVTKVADAIHWMTEQQRTGKPWFVWLAFNLSHITPGNAHPPTIVPNADMLDKASRDEIEACGGQFGSTNIGHCPGEALNRAMTNSMDTAFGKLLDAIRQIDPNAYVIVLGDNGTPMYGRPGVNFIDNMYIRRVGRGKGTGYESGTRVPLAIRGPGIRPGTSDAMVHVVDLYSTILDIAHAPIPQMVSNREGTGQVAIDSRSLAPILFGGQSAIRDPVHDFIVSETAIPSIKDGIPGPVREHHVSVRNLTYKVLCIRNGTDDRCQFYNLARDPIEEYPLAMPASCPATISTDFSATDEAANFCFLRQAVRSQSGL